MRILIDIGHPAHVHLFKFFASQALANRHEVFFTCREKEFEITLLRYYQFNFKTFGRKYNTILGKAFGMIKFDIKEIIEGIRFKPDVFLSCGSIYAAHAAFILRIPHISLEDTGNWEQVKLYLPFTTAILTSDVFPYDYGKKQIRYKSHHELAYLHPKYYKPKLNLEFDDAKLTKNKFVLIRFVAWNASHDKGQKGLSFDIKKELIKQLSKKFDVIISSEKKLPAEFEIYGSKFKPEEIHNIISNASFVIGEGTTMAMEAAVLGTPSIYINSLQYNNVKDMESYGLLFSLENEENILSKIDAIMLRIDEEDSILEKKNKMLNDKIDLTSFLVWFVENFPESFSIMKENPDYQLCFR